MKKYEVEMERESEESTARSSAYRPKQYKAYI
jgi:hypothetical protein